jgi:competence protein ComEC
LPRGWARAVLVPVAAVAIGFALAQSATLRALPRETLPFRAVVLTGRVAGVEILPEGRRVTVAEARLDDGTALRRRVRVRLRESDATELATGDTLRVRALLRPPSPPSYPGGWDLQRDAFFAGYAGYGFAIGTSERLARQPPSGLSAWMQHMREAIAQRMRARLPGTDGAVAATLMTGVPSAIPEADREASRASGLAHLLAVAGLHIGAVMGLAFALTRALLALSERTALFWPTKQVAAGAALAAGGFYMVLTGMHVPIVRSFAMASLVTLAALLGRRAVSVRGLALAAVALMVLEPQEVPGASFQMSFSAVLALIAGYEALRPWLRRLHGDGALWRRVAGHLAALALTSLLAGGASAPFGAYHFGRLQVYFVVANMIAVPITALWVMPLGLDGPVLGGMGWGVRVIVLIARNVTAWPLAVVPIPHMPGWGLALVGLGLACLGLWRTAWLRLIGLLPLALGLASPGWCARPTC